MSNRLDQEREKHFLPKRILYAKKEIEKLGIETTQDETCVLFNYKGSQVRLFAYSGWHTGKTIKDGRGLNNLLKQLK